MAPIHEISVAQLGHNFAQILHNFSKILPEAVKNCAKCCHSYEMNKSSIS